MYFHSLPAGQFVLLLHPHDIPSTLRLPIHPVLPSPLPRRLLFQKDGVDLVCKNRGFVIHDVCRQPGSDPGSCQHGPMADRGVRPTVVSVRIRTLSTTQLSALHQISNTRGGFMLIYRQDSCAAKCYIYAPLLGSLPLNLFLLSLFHWLGCSMQ